MTTVLLCNLLPSAVQVSVSKLKDSVLMQCLLQKPCDTNELDSHSCDIVRFIVSLLSSTVEHLYTGAGKRCRGSLIHVSVKKGTLFNIQEEVE